MGTNQRLRSKQKQNNSQKDGQIRIISGQWRGRKLPVKDVLGLRPTTDRVKETVFNWLNMYLRDANCLDCFAGSGSLGLEALSRYASYVTLIEKDKVAAKQLEVNLATLKSSQAKVYQQDCLQFLDKVGDQGIDIAFVDPPFRQNLLADCCNKLEQNQWLKEDALIYVEKETELTTAQLPTNWELLKEKTAGQVTYQLFARQLT
ncbi:16S rRNA (guanine(966)-N(2))-methyltransferase RsmD [Motilimonas pumila]|uniref:Ribosomal RNA small subunit methyltransferase D n=1 Tax=Motilimonas pumila TaxID=2303987 RepID=A0A418Y9I9_9GAMM|nr:16S rRNA (guanine(966)-N(2))-methyltransferase RsmD [Motilimonas pumila]RJG37556.1 16S rRNA (guanine(966)-N(2))-methyltransferase RsmD [Motilimonas pumila]